MVDCLTHEFAKAWLDVSGDSFVVDCRKGYSAGRLANYLGKYLTKSFSDRENLKAMGFIRRYSRSQNWPSVPKLETVVQKAGGWDKVEIVQNSDNWTKWKQRAAADRDSTLLERVGDDLTEIIAKKRDRMRGSSKLRKMTGEMYA